MPKVAALGPANTFSELAAKKYIESVLGTASVALFPTFGKAIAAVGKECDCAVLPIENMAEGYVSIVLDLLVHSSLSITHELLLPIRFSFAANCTLVEQVERVYAQFVSQGQCERFLDSLDGTAVITTQSNGTSLEELRKGGGTDAAIVPAFAVHPDAFPLVIEDVTDRKNNLTRFITVAAEPARFDPCLHYKTSLLIVESIDRPGILAEILSAFAKRQVNLVSIMSRPTKEMLGRYHFFIDVEGHISNPAISEALSEVMRENTIRILGSFPKARPVA